MELRNNSTPQSDFNLQCDDGEVKPDPGYKIGITEAVAQVPIAALADGSARVLYLARGGF